jgi:hypothetical protein
MNHDVKAARKLLFSWRMLLMPVLVFGCCYVTYFGLVLELQHLNARAPVLRFYAAAVLGPCIGITIIVALIALSLKAIPASEKVIARASFWTTVLVFANLPGFFFALLIARPLQQHYMPKLGYLECGLLHGNPTLYFTDWIKNPEWCVKGKDREWVFEQARLAEEKAVKPSNSSAPAQEK